MADNQATLPTTSVQPDSANGFDWNELDKAVEEYKQKRGGARPANSFTTREFAEREGIPVRTAQDRIYKMHRRGIIELAGTVKDFNLNAKGTRRIYYWRRAKRG